MSGRSDINKTEGETLKMGRNVLSQTGVKGLGGRKGWRDVWRKKKNRVKQREKVSENEKDTYRGRV